NVITEPVAARAQIGVVPQQPNPDLQLTVRENLVFHATYHGIPRAEASRRADALLERLGIADKGGAKAQTLSGGQKQRMMRAHAPSPATGIPAILGFAESRGYTVRDIHLSRPSLETLFISLTGRKLA